MAEDRETVEDLMHRYGYEEMEAQVAYHLGEAQDLFEKLYAGEPGEMASAAMFRAFYVDPHFHALNDLLARRVLKRDYPEGWGQSLQSEEEESGEVDQP